jgi:hypothetical protein
MDAAMLGACSANAEGIWLMASPAAGSRPLLSINIFYTLQTRAGSKPLTNIFATLKSTTGSTFGVKDCFDTST